MPHPDMLQRTPYKGYNEAVPRPSPLPRLRDLAQDQWGLVTRRQIEAAGIGTTTLERLTAPGGALERVATASTSWSGPLRRTTKTLERRGSSWPRTSRRG